MILGTDAGAPADADPHDLVHERLIATVDGGSGRG
jgi:hypothetical protein